jgi:catechol 2,3-dioxygenase-like lactoylglutathione lyase family enzyme
MPLKDVGAITLFVEEPERSKAFYANAFRRPLVCEDGNSSVFDLGNTLVNLLRSSEAHELIEPVPVASAESGSRFQLTIWVEDADSAAAELRARGVALLSGPVDRPWGQRTVTFADPDGHVWELAQTIERS